MNFSPHSDSKCEINLYAFCTKSFVNLRFKFNIMAIAIENFTLQQRLVFITEISLYNINHDNLTEFSLIYLQKFLT